MEILTLFGSICSIISLFITLFIAKYAYSIYKNTMINNSNNKIKINGDSNFTNTGNIND